MAHNMSLNWPEEVYTTTSREGKMCVHSGLCAPQQIVSRTHGVIMRQIFYAHFSEFSRQCAEKVLFLSNYDTVVDSTQTLHCSNSL